MFYFGLALLCSGLALACVDFVYLDAKSEECIRVFMDAGLYLLPYIYTT